MWLNRWLKYYREFIDEIGASKMIGMEGSVCLNDKNDEKYLKLQSFMRGTITV